MRTLLLFILFLLPVSLMSDETVIFINQGAVTSAGGADTYSDITYYHNAEALGVATYAAGSDSVSYGGGILLTSGDGIVGESWDNNDDGFDAVSIATTTNLDYSGSRLGFYWEPQEIAAGWIVFGDSLGWYAQFIDATTVNFVYQTGSENITTNFIAGTQYFLEFVFSGNDMEVLIDSVSKGTINGSSEANEQLKFFSADGNAWDAYIDQVFISTNTARDLNAIKDCTDCFPGA